MEAALPRPTGPTRLESKLDDYEAAHPRFRHRLLHAVASTTIWIAASGLLSALSLGTPFLAGAMSLDAGMTLWLASVVYYVWLEWRLGLAFGVTLLGGYVLSRQTWLAGFGWLLAILLVLGSLVSLWLLLFRNERADLRSGPWRAPLGPLWLFVSTTGYRT